MIASGGNEADAFADDDRKREKRLRDQDRAGQLERRLCGDYEPPFCSTYGKECLRDGQECDERCLREIMSAEDVDEATARGCWKTHQERDQ